MRTRDEIDRLYKTQGWKRLRKVILARDFGLCQECRRRGAITKGNIVHHKVEAREDLSLFWSESNLETVCVACHNRDHPERSGGKKKPRQKGHVVKFYSTSER